jgi:iron complex transport system permease protein
VSLLAQDRGRVNVTTMLLAGIAINALCGAGTGLMTFLATDEQLRTLTFWNLGSLGGATWPTVLSALPLILLGTVGLPLTARALNALTLGEHGAAHLGVPVTRVKWLIISLVALSVGAGVAVAGSIGFIGLVVPHLLRLLTGPNHATLLPASALLGATLLILADLLARTVAAPAEVPIGILTALLGAPFFLYLLRQRRAEGA